MGATISSQFSSKKFKTAASGAKPNCSAITAGKIPHERGTMLTMKNTKKTCQYFDRRSFLREKRARKRNAALEPASNAKPIGSAGLTIIRIMKNERTSPKKIANSLARASASRRFNLCNAKMLAYL